MNKAISPKLISLTFGILVISFLVIFYVLAWQEPTSAPPGGNVPAPLNVGDSPQGKSGRLLFGHDDPGNNWKNDAITGLSGPIPIHDAFLLTTGYTGTQTSDLRLYIVDDDDDRFSIWGGACSGGNCGDLNAAKNLMTILGNGNVGIGTTNPSQKLEVIGKIISSNYPPLSCPAGSAIRAINIDGSVICEPIPPVVSGIKCYCDADSDGYYSNASTTVAATTCAAAGCQDTIGNDCCDSDNHVYPGAGFSSISSGCGNWDLNCDGSVTKETSQITTWQTCGSPSCSSVVSSDPVCGATYTYQYCPSGCLVMGWQAYCPACGTQGCKCTNHAGLECGAVDCLATKTITQRCK